ncbi:MAG: RIP metalloprotease RseP [bacterium]
MIITLLIFIFILSLLVFVHEAGHFFTAKRFGIKVEEFGFGLPPRIFGGRFLSGQKVETISMSIAGETEINMNSGEITGTSQVQVAGKTETRKKWLWVWGNKNTEDQIDGQTAGTIYSLNWLPIGGFVKIKGENGDGKNDSDSFSNKRISRRIIVLASGVAMNFLLCAILLIIGFTVGLPAAIDGPLPYGAIVSQNQIIVMEVIDNMSAKEAGAKAGDIISAVDGQNIGSINDLHNYLSNKKDQTVKVLFLRDKEELTKDLQIKEYQGTTGIGVALAQTATVRYPWYLAIWQGIKLTFIWLWAIITAFAMLFKNLIIGEPTGVQVAGPVGIAVMTGQMAKLGFVYVLQFAALLSINLAIINILPFPALDGGRILFLIIEKMRGKAIKQQWENALHNLGFALLMLLVLFVTYKDVLRYGGKIISVVTGSISR